MICFLHWLRRMLVWKRFSFAHQVTDLWIRLLMLVSVVRGFRRIPALIAIKYHRVRPKMMSDIWHIRVTYLVICGIWRPDDSMQKVTAIHNKHAILWKLRLWLNFRLPTSNHLYVLHRETSLKGKLDPCN